MEKILTNLPALIQAGTAIWEFVMNIRETAKQTGEWTPELEQSYQDSLDKMKQAPHWQSDPKK